jgi:sulfur-oxidizing protein SoxA
MEHERVEFARDCEVVAIPGGERLTVPQGTVAYVTQSLGGAFTLSIPSLGGLFRLEGNNADAIGQEPLAETSQGDEGEDLESRVLTCMVKLQGFTPEEVKRKTFADQRANEQNTDLEAIVAYIAVQSDGMKLNPPMKHPKEKEMRAVGEAIFHTRMGPMDFSCSTCHGQDGKRIRLQELGNYHNKADTQRTMKTWPTYRVSHGVVRNMQHRMWDCMWQMRLPDVDYASPVTVALISFLADQGRGAVLDIPGIKR